MPASPSAFCAISALSITSDADLDKRIRPASAAFEANKRAIKNELIDLALID
jgi:hypothetical protein